MVQFRWGGRSIAAALATLAGFVALPVQAEEAGEGSLVLGAALTQDFVGVAADGRTRLRHAGLIELTADLSLESAIGLDGATLHAQAIATYGNRPNDVAATLQGVNNSETPDSRARLFEVYVEQSLVADRLSLRLGLSDLNSEFYATDASGVLIAPAFGIGSELAATGPNGPSIFPSTALTARLRGRVGRNGYAQVALVNAEAGVLGDRGGFAPLFKHGALVIGEAGISGDTKLAAGAWAYTRHQPALAEDDAHTRARGAYVLADVPVSGPVRGFLRAGLSEGRTTPYHGGWQAGLLVAPVLADRPESQFSIGVNKAYVTRRYRQLEADPASPVHATETAFEVTWSDTVAAWLTLQPDLQLVRRAAGQSGHRHAVVFGLRMIVSGLLGE